MLCPSKEKRRQKSGGAGTDTTYAGQTLTGRVTAMDGTAVTLALGELSEDAAPAGGASSDNDSQQPPEMPSGDSGSDSSFTENGETLTGDCVITSLTNNGTINFNGYTITLAGGTVLQ